VRPRIEDLVTNVISLVSSLIYYVKQFSWWTGESNTCILQIANLCILISMLEQRPGAHKMGCDYLCNLENRQEI